LKQLHYYFLAFFLICSFTNIKAQVCNGALGDPVISIDFGRGNATFAPPISGTTYRYIAGNPNDGQYTIVKTTNGLNSGWHQNVVNRTPNDPNGYFMLVNADNDPGVFYQSTVNNLCPNTTYEFAAYIINILRNSGVKPRIRFTITNNGLPIPGANFSTGDIQEGSATNWIKYGTTFKTPINVGTIALTMTNENPGGGGNDLAIDDITFRPCGPEIKPLILSTSSNTAIICEGKNANVALSATVSSTYSNPQYQWQVNNGAGWTNLTVAGSQTKDVVVPFTNAAIGTYSYQLLVADGANINSENCRIISSPLTVKVDQNPSPIATYAGNACDGGNITLRVNGNAGDKFNWVGPNGFSSTEQNPIISNITAANSGDYIVTLTNSSGCSATSNINLQVLPKIIPIINIPNQITTICEAQNIQLIAAGGTSYKWSPIDGLSNPTIANPLASPLKTTKYTVYITQGDCSTTTDVLVNVSKKANSNAGEDKKLLAGQTAQLNGKASGDNITYSWSPTDYLDDPTKENPIASPPKDITYTLTVKSDCNTSTDEVFVRVYPKIEIPNTFTPNNDGVNDTWNIQAAEAFTEPKLKVFNRNGQIIYESKGNFKPWDGKYNGKDVPTAAYYYTLFLNEDFQPFTGWVFLTR
jgi:gliding motility-associated-like protein